MGNAESIPVVSQFISLGQACQGDMEGALRTQEQFSRQALVISQLNSLVNACMGKNDEALKIQVEFAENTPVVGHIMAAVHAGQGDHEKAQEVAVKSTLPIFDTIEVASVIASTIAPSVAPIISFISGAVHCVFDILTDKSLFDRLRSESSMRSMRWSYRLASKFLRMLSKNKKSLK